jgi:isoleucyl-tRNA synthetase
MYCLATDFNNQSSLYDITEEDKKIFITLMGIIKTISKVLLGLDENIKNLINQHVYKKIQEFVQIHVSEFYLHASKKKKRIAT